MSKPAMSGITIVLLVAACHAGNPQQPMFTPGITVSIGAMQADSIAGELIDRLIASESELTESDSLYAPGATTIANGAIRNRVPRLAGVAVGGHVQLMSSRINAHAGFAWGILQYRWVPRFGSSGGIHIALATVVIAPQADGTWRIVHLHSSTTPIDAPRPAPSDTSNDAGRGDGGTL